MTNGVADRHEAYEGGCPGDRNVHELDRQPRRAPKLIGARQVKVVRCRRRAQEDAEGVKQWFMLLRARGRSEHESHRCYAKPVRNQQ